MQYPYPTFPHTMFNPGQFQLHSQMTPPPSPLNGLIASFAYHQTPNALPPDSPGSRRSSSSPSQTSQWDHHSTSSATSDARAVTPKAPLSAFEGLGRLSSSPRFLVLNNVPNYASTATLEAAFADFGDLAWFCTKWLKTDGAAVLAFFSSQHCADAHNMISQLPSQGRALFDEHRLFQLPYLTSRPVRACDIQSVDHERLGQVEASVLIMAEAFVSGAVLRDVLSKFGALCSFEPLDADGLKYACEYVDSRHANHAILELNNKPTILTVPLKVLLNVEPPPPVSPLPLHTIYATRQLCEIPPQAYTHSSTGGQMMSMPMTPVTPHRPIFPPLPATEVNSLSRSPAKVRPAVKKERTRHETLHGPVVGRPQTPTLLDAPPAVTASDIAAKPRLRRFSTGSVPVPGDSTPVATKKSQGSVAPVAKVEEQRQTAVTSPLTKIKETGDGLCVLEKGAQRTPSAHIPDVATPVVSYSPRPMISKVYPALGSRQSAALRRCRQPSEPEDDERVVYTPPAVTTPSHRNTVKSFFNDLRTSNSNLPPRLRQPFSPTRTSPPDPPTRRVSLTPQLVSAQNQLMPLHTRHANAGPIYQHPHSRDAPSPRNVVDLDRIAQGRDTRTTIMIKNVPSRMTHADMERFISSECEREFDFLYLRMDFVTGNNVGYAFVNFMEVSSLLRFLRRYLNTRWNMYSSDKIMLAAYATYQGKAALVTKFQNSSILDRDESVQPHIYHSSGEKKGLPEPFPAPNDTARKARSLAAANEHGLYSRMELHRRQQLGSHALKSRASLPHLVPVAFPSLDQTFGGLQPVGEETIPGRNRLF